MLFHDEVFNIYATEGASTYIFNAPFAIVHWQTALHILSGCHHLAIPGTTERQGKVSRLYPPDEGSLAGCGLQ